jgi:hypothetical protein
MESIRDPNEEIFKYAIAFSKDHPPPGWDSNSNIPIEVALNNLGRVMIMDIPVIGVSGVQFIVDESVMNDSDLTKRLASFVVSEPVPGDHLYINVKAPNHSPLIVKSNDIRLADGRNAPVLQNVEITALPPGKRLQVNLILRQGTARNNDNSNYAVVTTFNFYETVDGEYIFEYEMVKGFEDGEYVYKTAQAVIEGKIDPNYVRPTELDELLIDWH